MGNVPARIHFIVPSNSPKVVVFRRGPSRHTQLLTWNTNTGEIQEGQWFIGKIYTRRSHVSPNGKLLIYFASKFDKKHLNPDNKYTYAWTAISKPPYLTALAIWPKGDCWHGGGIFENNSSVWLNHKPEKAKLHEDYKLPKRLYVKPNPKARGEDFPIFSKRLKLNGWQLIDKGQTRYEGIKNGFQFSKPMVWEKKTKSYKLQYQLLSMGDSDKIGHYNEEFIISSGNDQIYIKDCQWANFSNKGELIFAKNGRLYKGHIGKGALKEELVADLNGNVFEEIESTEEASKW
jgi:hypothetical protein